MTGLYQTGKVNSRNFFTFSGMYHFGKERQHSPMTIDEIRRENARWLARKCGGPKQFAEVLDVVEARVSHLIGKNPTKNIGRQTARKIELLFGKQEGWLDTPNAWTTEAEDASSVVKTADISRLVALFGRSTDDGRLQIIRAAELAEKLPGDDDIGDK